MFAKIILLLTVVFLFSEVNCECPKGQNETICWTVRCANPEPCPIGQVLVKEDPKNCICCRYCENFHKHARVGCSDSYEMFGCNKERTIESCYATDCRPIDKCEKGQKFVKRDLSKCICCDTCIDDCSSY